MTLCVSIFVPITVTLIFGLSVDWSRLPIALLLMVYYLFLVQTLSFTVATAAFHLNRASSLTVTKNLALWLVTGDLVPLDLFPEWAYKVLIQLPFSNAVYVPVGFLTGRLGWDTFMHGFFTTTMGLLILLPLARVAWWSGIRKYAGTGA